MPKIWTASVIALFVAAVSLFTFGAPPPCDALADDAQAAVDAGAAAVAKATATTPAATSTIAPEDVGMPGSFGELVQAFRTGDWRLVAAFALAGIMMALRSAREKWAWFRGDRGGALLVFALSLFGALSTSLATHQAVNPQLFLSALAVTFTAVGGYTWIKRLIWPSGGDPAPATTDKPAPLPVARVV